MAKKLLKHIRVNEKTGAKTYYYPMPVENTPENQAFIGSMRALGYEVGWTRLGFEVIHAILVPCKNHFKDKSGCTVYVDTPESEQRHIYNEMIQEAMAEQNRKLHDGRCWFFKDGLRHRCQYRKKNPSYDPNHPHDPKSNPKTMRVRCEECPYERFKNAHDEALFSELEQEDDCGEKIPFEGSAVYDTYSFESYDELSADVMTVLHKLKPKLDDVVDLLAKGLTQADAAEALGKAPTTINSQVKSLRRLLDTVPELQELLLNN